MLIRLFSDFGWDGPYVGQVKGRLLATGVTAPMVDLMHDAPSFDPRASAYLLAALRDVEVAEGVWFAVVDPGVGGTRRGVVVMADGHWWVGPDNGLLALVVRRAECVSAWEIPCPGGDVAATFHGRDVFAPVAARLSLGVMEGLLPIDAALLDRPDWPEDWPAVIYVDHYGNAMTGVRGARLAPEARVVVGGRVLPRGRIFAEQAVGEAFWYVNSLGLVEVAVNQGSAARELGLSVGTPLEVLPPP